MEVLSLQQMLAFGRRALSDQSLVLRSARHVQRELPKRLARRLMDLQLLPYIVVTNPHIRKVQNTSAFTWLPQTTHDQHADPYPVIGRCTMPIGTRSTL